MSRTLVACDHDVAALLCLVGSISAATLVDYSVISPKI